MKTRTFLIKKSGIYFWGSGAKGLLEIPHYRSPNNYETGLKYVIVADNAFPLKTNLTLLEVHHARNGLQIKQSTAYD